MSYQREEPNPVMVPVASATAVAADDPCAVVADLLVPAPSFTWDTDIATTRKAFVAAFVGVSQQDKDADHNVFGQGGDFALAVRTNTAGVHRLPVAAGTYKLFDLVGPKKATGNALTSTLEGVTDPAQAIGEVVGLQGVNPGYCEVRLFSKKAPASKGLGQVTILSFPITLSALTNGDYLTEYAPGFAGEILSVDFRVGKPATTAAKAATINLEIGTTNLTGGVVALTSANCTPSGAAVAGTAVTANNVFAATDVISIEASSVTAFVEGDGVLLVKVRNRG